MRTSITLDATTHELASVYAKAKGITLGAAIGELIRKGQASTSPAASKMRTTPSGFPLFPRQNRVLTSAMVKRALEDDLG